MARTTTCDGTGVAIPDDTPTTGHYGHQYSAAARLIAEEYQRRVDEAHAEAAKLFSEKLAALRAEYRPQLAQLPDDP